MGWWYLFVAHWAVVATFKILFLFAYFFLPLSSLHPSDSLGIFFYLFVSFFGSVTDNTTHIYSKLELNCFQLSFSILSYFSLQDSKYIDILSSNLFVFVPSSSFFVPSTLSTIVLCLLPVFWFVALLCTY